MDTSWLLFGTVAVLITWLQIWKWFLLGVVSVVAPLCYVLVHQTYNDYVRRFPDRQPSLEHIVVESARTMVRKVQEYDDYFPSVRTAIQWYVDGPRPT